MLQICYEQRDEVIQYGKGIIKINRNVNRSDSDFQKLYEIAEHFAALGYEVELTPIMTRPSRFKYEGKCPDLLINGKRYEHEGYITNNPKNAFRNMMRDGLEQCNRLILDRPNLTERFMRRGVFNRINNGEDIQEIWLRNPDGTLCLLYKKNGRLTNG